MPWYYFLPRLLQGAPNWSRCFQYLPTMEGHIRYYPNDISEEPVIYWLHSSLAPLQPPVVPMIPLTHPLLAKLNSLLFPLLITWPCACFSANPSAHPVTHPYLAYTSHPSKPQMQLAPWRCLAPPRSPCGQKNPYSNLPIPLLRHISLSHLGYNYICICHTLPGMSLRQNLHAINFSYPMGPFNKMHEINV